MRFLEWLRCVLESFSEGVRDTFGTSIVSDILDPILKEIDSLRAFNAVFQQQSLSIDQTLADAAHAPI
jgi:hypothetical protein